MRAVPLFFNSSSSSMRGRWSQRAPTTRYTCGTCARDGPPSCTPSSSTGRGSPSATFPSRVSGCTWAPSAATLTSSTSSPSSCPDTSSCGTRPLNYVPRLTRGRCSSASRVEPSRSTRSAGITRGSSSCAVTPTAASPCGTRGTPPGPSRSPSLMVRYRRMGGRNPVNRSSKSSTRLQGTAMSPL
ncbi:hypothetical protein CRUP_016944 [Coryphaenoides rupestris]|nr:hypothetical protein CRUP_016944 [Coryphaenoides rupestris]